MVNLAAGHRLAPHTADCIVEAWGPDRAACLTEAVVGLVEGFAAAGDIRSTTVMPIRVGPGRAEDELVELLEEVIFNLDTLSVVPVRFHLRETDNGAVTGEMEVVPIEETAAVGPAPKAVTYHELSMVHDQGGWRCRVLVDV